MTLVSISAIHMYLGPLRYSRPTVTLLLLSMLIAVLNRSALRWENLTQAWPSKGVFFLLLLAVLGAPLGLSLGTSVLYTWDRYIKVLVVFFLMVAAIRNTKDLAVMIWSYVASLAVLVVLAMTVLEVDVTSTGLQRLGGGSSMFDANDLAMLMVMGLPLALLCFFTSRSIGRYVAGATLIGIPMVIAQTGSRGAMVGLVLTAPFLLTALPNVSATRRLLISLTVVAGIFLGAPQGYWKQMQTIFNPSEDYNVGTDYGRTEIAKRGLGYMITRPVAGVGIANFPRAEGTISPIIDRRVAGGLSVEWIAPHNTYVQVGAELGVTGLLLWLSLLYAGTVTLWGLKRQMPKDWESRSGEHRYLLLACRLMPVTVLGFMVTSFFLSHAYTPPYYTILSFIAGLQLIVRRQLKAERSLPAAV